MTIGIGVLCSTMPRAHRRPDAVVLLSDVVGSTDAIPTNDVQKVYVCPDERLICTCVGQIERAGDLIPAIQNEFQQLKTRNRRTFAEAVHKAVYGHRAEHFQYDVLPRHYFIPGDISRDQHSELTQAWQQYDIGVHLLVATFNDDGQAVMYLIARMENPSGWVHPSLFPGIVTIGLGAHAANFWLNYRRQVWGCNVRQSAYHAYEAERLATKPSSDINMEMVIATNEKTFHLTHDVPELDECPVGLTPLTGQL
jgi:20S proteasome alpha/beta subunit